MIKEIKRPIDAKYGQSCLVDLIKHQNYLTYCYASKTIQDYWCRSEYVVYPINKAMQQPVPIVTSNINPGDFFNLGKTPTPQIGIVYRKLTIIQSGLNQEQWKPSPNKPGGDYLKYEIGGDIGGFFYTQPHNELASGFFVWLPLPCQLIAADLLDEAQALQTILLEIAHEQ
ncbi:MAG: hypothetical protein KME45_03455 [Stenomitos rutilans HA7619-LM2]|jgi:hypothetical protein|nr:hypothetical protein [Stenomitos rutilans HA7619-LM2]MBW4469442.1 hypothetical protein [Stenomitos rutilans HA7619-LM2]